MNHDAHIDSYFLNFVTKKVCDNNLNLFPILKLWNQTFRSLSLSQENGYGPIPHSRYHRPTQNKLIKCYCDEKTTRQYPMNHEPNLKKLFLN